MTVGAPAPAPGGAPPSTFSIAGKMIGGALRSTPAKVIGIVIGALVAVAALIAGIANGIGGAVVSVVVAAFILFVLGFIIAIPALIVVLFIAAGRARSAESSAMQAYARARQLGYAPSGTLPEATPLLKAGTSRGSQDLMTGLLPGGLQGSLVHYTYYVRRSSGQQGSHNVPYPNTVVIAQIPESMAFVRRLLCHGGGRLQGTSVFGLDLSGDAEVELESAAVNERYRIRTSHDQDQAWLRQLFTPVFVDWLAAAPMRGFSFELVDGLLCVSVADRLDTAYDLDWLCTAAAYVAGRVRGEVAEESARPG